MGSGRERSVGNDYQGGPEVNRRGEKGFVLPRRGGGDGHVDPGPRGIRTKLHQNDSGPLSSNSVEHRDVTIRGVEVRVGHKDNQPGAKK